MSGNKQQIAVIGLGRFGRAVAEELHKAGHEVIGIDSDRNIVQNIAAKIPHAVQVDAVDENALRQFQICFFVQRHHFQRSPLPFCQLAVRKLFQRFFFYYESLTFSTKFPFSSNSISISSRSEASERMLGLDIPIASRKLFNVLCIS